MTELFHMSVVLCSQLALSHSQKLGLGTWVEMALVPCLLVGLASGLKVKLSAGLAGGLKVKSERGNTQGTGVLGLAQGDFCPSQCQGQSMFKEGTWIQPLDGKSCQSHSQELNIQGGEKLQWFLQTTLFHSPAKVFENTVS